MTNDDIRKDAVDGLKGDEWACVASRGQQALITLIENAIIRDRARRDKKPDKAINILFDGPPDHNAGRFVEVETDDGKAIKIGKWIERNDGLWALQIENLYKDSLESMLVELARIRGTHSFELAMSGPYWCIRTPDGEYSEYSSPTGAARAALGGLHKKGAREAEQRMQNSDGPVVFKELKGKGGA